MGQMFMKPGTPATIAVGEQMFNGEAVCVHVEYEDPRTRVGINGAIYTPSHPAIQKVTVTMRNGAASQVNTEEVRLRALKKWEASVDLSIPVPHEAVVGWAGPHGFTLRLPREDQLCECCGRVIYAYTETLAECRARVGQEAASRYRANRMIAAWCDPRAAVGGGARFAHPACLYRLTHAKGASEHLKQPGALVHLPKLLVELDEKGEQKERIDDAVEEGHDLRSAWQCEVQKARDALAKTVRSAVELEQRMRKDGDSVSAETYTILEPKKGDLVRLPDVTGSRVWRVTGKGRPGIAGYEGPTLDLVLDSDEKTKATVAMDAVRFVERPGTPAGFGRGAVYGQRVSL